LVIFTKNKETVSCSEILQVVSSGPCGTVDATQAGALGSAEAELMASGLVE
jgi:hypothetical protein